MSIETKYQQLANELEEAIRSGQLAVGARLASVRTVMQQRGVSLATVVTAYRALEERGLVAARAKSGYFVTSATDAKASPARFSIAAAGAKPNTSPVHAHCPQPELFPQQRLHRLTASVVRRHQHLATTYPHGLGNSKLREEIARRSADYGSFLRPDDLMITAGATEALTLALLAVAQPGDCIALEAPANPLFLTLLAKLHLQAVEIPTSPRGLSLDALQQAVATHPNLRACLLIPNFHHPTGALMPVAAKRALLNYAASINLSLIEDDVYGDLQYEGTRPPPLKAYDTEGRVIYLSSYSKNLAPGLRVGWIAAGRWHDRIAKKKLEMPAVSELPQLVLYEFLNRGSHLPHLRRMRQALRDNTLRAHDHLTRAMPDACHWTLPAGGYFMWLELPDTIDTALLATQPELAPLHLLPGSRCSQQFNFSHCLRINTSLLNDDASDALISALNRALQ